MDLERSIFAFCDKKMQLATYELQCGRIGGYTDKCQV